jgi:hypothetical protein
MKIIEKDREDFAMLSFLSKFLNYFSNPVFVLNLCIPTCLYSVDNYTNLLMICLQLVVM